MKAHERAGSATDLARRVARIETSPTQAMAQRAAAMRARGERVLDFSIGEPDQPTPAHISAAGGAALEAGRTRYTPSGGLPELREAVAYRYKKDFKVSFGPEEVAVSTGGKHALYSVCQVLLERGDEVVIPSPYWPTFSEAVRLAGARPIMVPALEKDGFQVTARMVSKVTSQRTRAVILNSPNNPTGAVIAPDDLLVIGDMSQRRKFTILYDDTYARLTYGRSDGAVLSALKDSVGDRFVILGTASKSYCMTGWRIGWVLGPRPLIDACIALFSHSTQCPTSFAQAGAVEALTGPQKVVHELLAEYRRRRDFIHPAMVSIPDVTCVEPGGGFYLFPNVGRYLSSRTPSTMALTLRMLDETGVATVPGEAFGVPGYIRVSFARPIEELMEGAQRVEAFLRGLR